MPGRKASRSRRKAASGSRKKATGDGQSIPVVGIGASAGGLEAFRIFFQNMPSTTHMAFVLIQHLDPTHESLMADLLERYTSMTVRQAADGMVIEPNHVYVIPPNRYLSIDGDALRLTEAELRRGMRMPVDCFFRSLAEQRGERAIGVILSGTGSDGTLGAQAIKEAEGTLLAEDPREAAYSGMPENVIATGLVDIVLPVREMPTAILEFAQRAFQDGETTSPQRETAAGHVASGEGVATWDDQLAQIITLLHARTHYDFGTYKPGTLQRRIERRLGLNRLDRIEDYIPLLRAQPDELDALYRDLLIGVTRFFRDPVAFEELDRLALAPLVEQLGAPESFPRPLRVWVPGCATGEEAYSVAMLLIERLAAARRNADIQVFATDVDADAMAVARNGVFPETIAADVSAERLSRFFRLNGDSYRIGRQLREAVVFAQQSVISDPPFSKLDLICCRNLLIYLQPEIQQKLLALFHFALTDGGFLFLGTSESIGQQSELFQTLSSRWRIFLRQGPSRVRSADIPILLGRRQRTEVAPDLAEPRASVSRLAELTRQFLLREYSAAAVVINRRNEIQYQYGPTTEYLDLPEGEPTHNLLEMARDGLKGRLRTAVLRATRNGERIRVTGARVRRSGHHHPVRFTVLPIDVGQNGEPLRLANVKSDDSEAERPADVVAVGSTEPNVPASDELRQEMFLVIFEEEPETVSEASTSALANADALLVQQLEAELRATREDLQSHIEELQTANEEVMSMNQELQSTNEELETSSEELQSLNEELNTANTQLQTKVEELEAASNDISNLLHSTNIATLFLDRDLRIRRFTPAATKLFRLISSDVSRPIEDVAWNVSDADLIADARGVLNDLVPVEREVGSGSDGELCWLRRVQPYRTLDDRIEGVVVTFVDITDRKQMEQRLRQLNEELEDLVEERSGQVKRLAAAVDNLGEGVLMTDAEAEWPDTQIIYANAAMCRISGYSQDELIGQTRRLLHGEGTEHDRLDTLRRELKAGRRAHCELTCFRQDGQPFDDALTVSPVTGRDGRVVAYVSIHFDLSERKKIEQALKAGQERLRALLNTAADAIITIDEHGVIQDANPAAVRMFGYAQGELIGQNVSQLMPSPYREEHNDYIARYVNTGEARIIGIGREVTGRRKDGSMFPIDLAVSEIDYLGLFTGIIRDISDRKRLEHEVLEATAQEQQRIGQDLHDDLGQRLGGLGMTADALAKTLARQGRGPEENLARQIQQGLKQAGAQVRSLAYGLVPVDVSAHSLADALNALALQFHEPDSIQCFFDCATDVDVQYNQTATHLFRIAQEAVTNAVRHGFAQNIWITVGTKNDLVILTVRDDGVGFKPNSRTVEGVGLRSMRYRADQIQAHLNIESIPNQGTTVIYSVRVAPGESQPT